MITKNDIIEVYVYLRKYNNSIPDEVLEFIKTATLEKLEKYNNLIENNYKTVDKCEFLYSNDHYSCGNR